MVQNSVGYLSNGHTHVDPVLTQQLDWIWIDVGWFQTFGPMLVLRILATLCQPSLKPKNDDFPLKMKDSCTAGLHWMPSGFLPVPSREAQLGPSGRRTQQEASACRSQENRPRIPPASWLAMVYMNILPLLFPLGSPAGHASVYRQNWRSHGVCAA